MASYFFWLQENNNNQKEEAGVDDAHFEWHTPYTQEESALQYAYLLF